MLRGLRNFLIMVPSFPNVVPGFDTQPFYLFLLWSEYRPDPRRIIAFCLFMVIGCLEFLTLPGSFGFINLISFSILVFMVCLLDWSRDFIERFYAMVPRLMAVILVLSAVRMAVPGLEFLFSPRDFIISSARTP